MINLKYRLSNRDFKNKHKVKVNGVKRYMFLLHGSSFHLRELITRLRQCLSQPITAQQYLGIQHRSTTELQLG